MLQKIKSILLQALPVTLATLLVMAIIYAWTEPTAPPPGGNVPAPLNVGLAGQSKSGGLILNTGGAGTGLIVATGTVGIGTTTPSGKLQVVGDGVVVGNPTGGNKGAGNINAEKIYVGGNELVEMVVVRGSNPNCPSGYAEMNKQWVARTCSCAALGCPTSPCGAASSCTTDVRWREDPPTCGFGCGEANLGTPGRAAGCTTVCNSHTCTATSWSVVLCIKQY